MNRSSIPHEATRPLARTAVATATAVVLALTATACTAVDRAGGKAAQDVTTLTFGQPNDAEPPDQLVAWAERVLEASDGTVVIEFENGWRLGETSYEADTLADVKAGEVDLAWVGARAFDRVGVTDFQALLAPLAVDSHDLQQAVFEAGIPEEMLAGVQTAGVQGIGVLPGPMRKVMGVEHPFVTPDDFTGQVVGTQDSAQSVETLEALGATAKTLPSGADISEVDGYEQQLSSIYGNGYYVQAGFVSANLNLWPRPLVIVANQETYDDLTAAQRDALSTATEQAVLGALDASRAEDAENVGDLCVEGMQLVEASTAQLASLERAVAPVYDRLRTDAKSAAWLDEITQLKAELTTPPDSAGCEGQEEPGAAGVLPNGTYRTTLTREAVLAGCQPGDPGAEAMLGRDVIDRTLELEVSGDRINQTEYPVGKPEQREQGWRGTYRTFRHTFELLEEGIDEPLAATFDFDGERLVLTDMQTDYCDHQVVWTEHPWELVAEDEQPADDELEGEWTTEVSAADWSGAGYDGPAGTFTLTFDDGVVKVIDPPGEVGFRANYSTFRGSLVTSGGQDELHASYELSGDTLTFTDLTVAGMADPGPYGVVWTTHPFTRRS